jgi:hypothetical protein
LLGFQFLRDFFTTATKKLVTKSLWYKDKTSNNFRLLESFQNFDWNEAANTIRAAISNLVYVVMEFFDSFMERDEDSTTLKEGSMYDTLDLEAIRKMGGIKL